MKFLIRSAIFLALIAPFAYAIRPPVTSSSSSSSSGAATSVPASGVTAGSLGPSVIASSITLSALDASTVTLQGNSFGGTTNGFVYWNGSALTTTANSTLTGGSTTTLYNLTLSTTGTTAQPAFLVKQGSDLGWGLAYSTGSSISTMTWSWGTNKLFTVGYGSTCMSRFTGAGGGAHDVYASHFNTSQNGGGNTHLVDTNSGLGQDATSHVSLYANNTEMVRCTTTGCTVGTVVSPSEALLVIPTAGSNVAMTLKGGGNPQTANYMQAKTSLSAQVMHISSVACMGMSAGNGVQYVTYGNEADMTTGVNFPQSAQMSFVVSAATAAWVSTSSTTIVSTNLNLATSGAMFGNGTAAAIRGTITPAKEGDQIYNTVDHYVCISTSTDKNSWCQMHAPTTACGH